VFRCSIDFHNGTSFRWSASYASWLRGSNVIALLVSTYPHLIPAVGHDPPGDLGTGTGSVDEEDGVLTLARLSAPLKLGLTADSGRQSGPVLERAAGEAGWCSPNPSVFVAKIEAEEES
jgi:hypothetical protein